jgi:hypothetical protein
MSRLTIQFSSPGTRITHNIYAAATMTAMPTSFALMNS